MPTVLIWLPEGDNTFGHAALRTDKYHISLWPFKGKELRISEASITGRLHFHEHLDCISEGSRENPREPTSRHEIVNVTNEAINRVYEDFLRYNEIKPEEVTVEAAERYIAKTECLKRLSRTHYSLFGDVIVDKRIEKSYSDLLFFIMHCSTRGWGNIDICLDCIGKVTQSTHVTCPFYHKAQSCVTICFNLIEMADRRRLVCLVEARNNTKKTLWSRFWQMVFLGGGGICLEITVPNFEKHVVQKYWKEGSGQRVHYDDKDFQKRSRFLMMSENLYKKVFMVGPTISSMSWLRNSLDFSFLELFGFYLIIHLMYFVFFYLAMKLFPSVLRLGRLPKEMAFIGGPLIFLFWLLDYFLNYTTAAFNLGKDGLIFFLKFYVIIVYFLVD
jgi:hypothetical protein